MDIQLDYDKKDKWNRVGDRPAVHFVDFGTVTEPDHYVGVLQVIALIIFILIVAGFIAFQFQTLQESYAKPKSVVMKEQVWKQLPHVPTYKLIVEN